MNTFDKCYESNDRMIIVNDMNIAREVLGSDNFKVPNLGDYLSKVEAATDDAFTVTKRFIGVSPFFLDGPRHAKLRMLAMRFFEQKNIARWDTFLTLNMQQMVDALKDKQDIELTADIAIPIFLNIAQPMLGLYPKTPDYFFTKAMKLQQLVEPMQSLKRIRQFESDLDTLVNGLDKDAAAIAQRPGAQDLPTFMEMMAQTEALNEDELNAFVITLFAAIAPLAQTAVNMIVHIYSQHDGVAPSNAEFVAQFDTYLATSTAPKYIHRTAIDDIMIGDQLVAAGKTVLIDMQALAANASAQGHSPSRLAFGLGKHVCVGAPLSKKVLKSLLTLFMAQFPRLELGDAKINDANLIANEYLYYHVSPN